MKNQYQSGCTVEKTSKLPRGLFVLDKPLNDLNDTAARSVAFL